MPVEKNVLNVQDNCPQCSVHCSPTFSTNVLNVGDIFLSRVLLAYTSFFISLLYRLRYLFMYGLHLLFTES